MIASIGDESSSRASSLLASVTASGTSGKSGCGVAPACMTTAPSKPAHDPFTPSHPTQSPSSSPFASACRISEVPRYPVTTRVGNCRVLWRMDGYTCVTLVRPVDPSFSKRVEAFQSAMLEPPLLTENRHAGQYGYGEPMNSNFLTSKVTDVPPINCAMAGACVK